MPIYARIYSEYAQYVKIHSEHSQNIVSAYILLINTLNACGAYHCELRVHTMSEYTQSVFREQDHIFY